MAQLHYANLTEHRPDILIWLVYHGLSIFYRFLKSTKDHLERGAVLRLGWQSNEPGRTDPKREYASEGHWITLTTAPDRPLEPAKTFRAFLDESTTFVYEFEAPKQSPRRTRHEPAFQDQHRIAVLDRDPESNELRLERRPELPQLAIRPNTWPLQCQLTAVRSLQDAPSAAHRPLLRLFEGNDHAHWPTVSRFAIGEEDWMLLHDAQRPGTKEQRRFVEIALATPDFAFLEGPPGAGKTTAICELALQAARRDKRVLLCAPTHVAVDNVLERLTAEDCSYRDLVTPVRIGDEGRVSAKAKPYLLKRLVETERRRLLRGYREHRKRASLTPAQQSLFDALQSGDSVVERLHLETANLVCGTMIGFLQHPDIKSRNGDRHDPTFDLLIVDEASKTTFQEFLVPGLLAKRWIIVGDPKQLSPYVDDEAMVANVDACLPDEHARNACVDAFLARHGGRGSRAAVVAVADEKARRAYGAQCAGRDVILADADASNADLCIADIVIGTPAALADKASAMPLDTGTVRSPDNQLDTVHRQAAAWLRRTGVDGDDRPDWGTELGWRLATVFQQRLAERPAPSEWSSRVNGAVSLRETVAERLQREVEALLPVAESDEVRRRIDNVRRVALPSILESLRCGFERGRQTKGSALTDGLPRQALDERHVLLEMQHRMHPDIAAFSHEHIYDGNALRTPPDLATKRGWSYSDQPAIWRHVGGGYRRHSNSNPREADEVIGELKDFDTWARGNPRHDDRPWEAAVLCFYRGQELEVRRRLRRWIRQPRATRHFRLGRPHLTVELCTVDGFQGHEADLVVISFAKPHATPFLESPNRLNVALTRARYGRVIVGDRKGLARRDGLLKTLAENEPWGENLAEETRE